MVGMALGTGCQVITVIGYMLAVGIRGRQRIVAGGAEGVYHGDTLTRRVRRSQRERVRDLAELVVADLGAERSLNF